MIVTGIGGATQVETTFDLVAFECVSNQRQKKKSALLTIDGISKY